MTRGQEIKIAIPVKVRLFQLLFCLLAIIMKTRCVGRGQHTVLLRFIGTLTISFVFPLQEHGIDAAQLARMVEENLEHLGIPKVVDL